MKNIKKVVKKIIPKKYRSDVRSLYNHFRSLSYFGLKYQCNICNGHFRKLLPMGINKNATKNIVGGGYRFALCPRCHSTDRERLTYWYLTNKTNILSPQKKTKLLHIAPENNLKKVFSNINKIEYIDGDLNPLKAENQMDITDINFEDNYFDFIICNHVLEHVKDDKKAMRELFRVLKPGGEAILQVPIFTTKIKTFEDFSIVLSEEREKYFGQKDHLRIYGKDYKDKLEGEGFKVKLYDIKNDLNNMDIVRHGINSEEILYIGYK
ncbi:MAG: class I SAM-dependent methyltransferase [Ignavibacteriales bacterium]|nr:class I SAM-dependent methyltransferase [Ignavibacteriales bacterium]